MTLRLSHLFLMACLGSACWLASDLVSKKTLLKELALRGTFHGYTSINNQLPQSLKQGYYQPVWPRSLPRLEGLDAKYPLVFKGKERALVELLSFERSRLGRNLTIYELGCDGCEMCRKINLLVGLLCIAVDISNVSVPHYVQHDLSSFFRIEGADWILSFENAEHIRREFEHNYIKTIQQARVGLIVAWAKPGQGGMGHHNERSQSYVKEAIEKDSALRSCEMRTTEFRNKIGCSLWNCYHHSNPIVFYKGLAQEEFDEFCGSKPGWEMASYFFELLCVILLLFICWQHWCQKPLQQQISVCECGKVVAE